jgi:hypothetical protein
MGLTVDQLKQAKFLIGSKLDDELRKQLIEADVKI